MWKVYFILMAFIAAVACAKVNLIDIYRKEVFDYAVLRNYKPVVVFFSDRSCTICNGLQTKLEDFAKENSEKMYLATVDFGKRPELKDYFGIDKVPTTQTYYKGKMMDEFKGPVWPAVKYISNKLIT